MNLNYVDTRLKELRRDNPRLLELTEAYRDLKLPFENSLWRTFSDSIDIQNFRGEPGYLSQRWGGMTDERYLASYDYLRHNETLDNFRHDMGLFDRLDFGVVGIPTGAAGYITRDFIDSALEIGFLWDTLHWSPGDPIHVLDIGAGYGRFAYWLSKVFPVWSISCVDAVPVSTFLCDFYLRYRRVSHAATIPLTFPMREAQWARPFSIACNMQSFSEMPLAAVRFWLDLCVDLDIRVFFLEPHSGDLIHPHYVTSEVDGSHLNYYGEFERHGYSLIAQRSKFPQDQADQYIYNTDMLMFERK